MEFRHYRDADYEAVCAFLIALNRTERAHINWNWARFEWMYEHPEFDKGARGDIGLWWDRGCVVGAAIYDMYFGEAFCGVLPEYADRCPEVLDYAWRALRDENGLGVAICEGNAPELEAVRAAGFASAEQTETVLRLPLDRMQKTVLPAGYVLREIDPVSEPEAFQWLLWQGFDHGADRAEFAADFERTMALELSPRRRFDRRLSLTACDGDGVPAAYCCVWYRPDTDYAYVEPVCTVPAHRSRGLAAALLTEALDRARALGAADAFVISDQAFYQRLGFAPAAQYRFYWKRPEA